MNMMIRFFFFLVYINFIVVFIYMKKKIFSPIFLIHYIFKRYMYSGIVSIDDLDVNEILELLEASDELCFSELIEDLQKHFINKKGDWIQQNLIYFHDFLTEN